MWLPGRRPRRPTIFGRCVHEEVGMRLRISRKLDQFPIISPVLSRRAVRRTERSVSDLLFSVRSATAEVLKLCGAEATVRARLFGVREQVNRLAEKARAPLLERLDAAERRLEETQRTCALVAPAVPEE